MIIYGTFHRFLLTGLGIHTLRYYEHEGSSTPERNARKRYTELRAASDTTFSERMEILMWHRQALNEQIAQLQDHKIKLDEKIELIKETLY